MLKEYIKYLKDNPKKLWFKRKLYGWGWVPARWQGWLTLVIYLGIVIFLLTHAEKPVPGNPDSGSNFLVLGFPILLLTIILIYICYKKGEKPKWQWGKKDLK